MHDDDTPGLASSQHETFGDVVVAPFGGHRTAYDYACALLPGDLLHVLQGLRVGASLLDALARIEAADSLERLYGAQGRAHALAFAALVYDDLPDADNAALDLHTARRVALRLALLQGFSV